MLPQSAEYAADELGRSDVFRTFDIASGLEREDPYENSPPRFVHVVLEAGDLSAAFPTFAFPTSGSAAEPVEGLLGSEQRTAASREQVARALFLGERTWGGRTGAVVLVPPYEVVDSLHAGHLVVRWREAGRTFALSLHAWEPFPEALDALQAMVVSRWTAAG